MAIEGGRQYIDPRAEAKERVAAIFEYPIHLEVPKPGSMSHMMSRGAPVPQLYPDQVSFLRYLQADFARAFGEHARGGGGSVYDHLNPDSQVFLEAYIASGGIRRALGGGDRRPMRQILKSLPDRPSRRALKQINATIDDTLRKALGGR